MNEFRVLRLIGFLVLSSLFGTVTPWLAAEDVIELSGGCSLYDAIIADNTDTESGACPAGRGADTIRLTADVTLERELPPIVSTISIEGEGYTVSGDDAFGIFHVDYDGALSIRNITLARGYAERGGAILNHGITDVADSQLNGNRSDLDGGAIYNSGSLTVISSSLIGNIAKGSYVRMGGAISNDGDATLSHSLLTHNEATSGAAISNFGDMRISSSSISANEGRYVGAIENEGWLTIEWSSITDNVSWRSAGIESNGPTSRLVVTDSTISGNRAVKDGVGITARGGGLSAYGTVILTHVTIVDDEADEAGGISRRESMGGLVIMRNSIVAGNKGGDCTVGLHEQVNSIIGDGSCDARTQGDPLLDEVGAHYVPVAGSPAIAAGDPLYCTPVDQFGNERPRDEPCDIGAVEAPEIASPTSPVKTPRPTATPQTCTFEDEIIAANTDAPYGACPAGDGADTIVMRGDALLSNVTLRVTSDIIIEGNGYTIQDYYKRSQLIEVLGGNLTLRNLTLSEGYSPWTGGAIAVLRGHLTLHNVTIRDSSAVIGGAIFNDHGDVTIVNSRFINNSAIDLGSWNTGWGGAIFNSGRLEVRNSLFSANSADAGAAIINIGDGARLEISGSQFSSNTAVSLGGAVANNLGGFATISRSLFMDNFVTGQIDYPGHPGGGGAVASLDEIHIRNSTFTRNGAAWGGAIFIDHPNATLEQLTIVRNGGFGIYVLDHSVEGSFTLTNSLIAGNKGDDCWVSEYVEVIVMRGNLIQDGSCSPAIQADPLLPAFDAMASTMTLQAGSPAIDAGDPEYCLPFDQLGTARPAGAGCDIGATEYIAA